MLRKPRLFTAGPTPVHERAVAASVGPLPYHRGPEFTRCFERVQVGLGRVFRTAGPVAVLTTSGTGGMEAAVANLFAPGERVLVLAGGKFGERWAEIAAAYGLEAVVSAVPPGATASPDSVAARLREEQPIAGVLMTASETSTGTVFDVEGITAAARSVDPEVAVVVDAITAAGALPVRTDDWELDAVVGGAQKAFMIPPGLAFVACSPRGWERVGRARSTARYYLDLRRYSGDETRRQIPFTPAIGLVLQLDAALTAIDEVGGIHILEQNADRLARAARAAAGELGLELLSSAPSPAVTAILAPRPGSAPEVVARLRDRFGAQISGGQGDLKPDLFRIGHLGYFDDLDLLTVVAGVEEALATLGHGFEAGRGVAAASRVLSSESSTP